MNLSTQVLVFQNTELTAITRDGQVWMRLTELAGALYGKGGVKSDVPFDGGVRQLQSLFQRRADEFTSSMTALVEQMTAGGKQMVRIFSLRGAHLLAMFARTPVAKAFRRWVLDILDQEVVRARPVRVLGPRHLGEIKAILAKRVMEAVTAGVVDPMNQHRAIERAYRNIAAALLARFAVADVTEIPAAKFLAAREFVETVAVDWELVDEPPKPAGRRYHFPIADTKPHDHDPVLSCDMLSPRVLMDPKNRALELELLDQMARDGHDVSGARLRVMAMRDALARYMRAQVRMAKWAKDQREFVDELECYGREEGIGVLFSRPLNPSNKLDQVAYREQFAAMGVAP